LLDRGRTGDLLARGTSDAGLLREMPRAVADIVFGTLTLLGASVFMLAIDPVTVGVVIAVMGWRSLRRVRFCRESTAHR